MYKIGIILGFPGGSVVKNLPANAGATWDVGLIPGSGRSSGVANDNPLWDSCLENSMDRGAWWAEVHVVAKSQTWLSEYIIFKCTLKCTNIGNILGYEKVLITSKDMIPYEWHGIILM